jgi:anti-anti-sigma factor
VVEITRSGARVSVVGELLSRSDRDLLDNVGRAAIAAAVEERLNVVTIDVARTGYCDSRALSALHGLARRCRDLGLSLVLEGASEELQEQLELTGLDQILAAYGTDFRARDERDSSGATP